MMQGERLVTAKAVGMLRIYPQMYHLPHSEVACVAVTGRGGLNQPD